MKNDDNSISNDKKATMIFAIRNILIGHCSRDFGPDMIEDIMKEITEEIENSPTSWAFD